MHTFEANEEIRRKIRQKGILLDKPMLDTAGKEISIENKFKLLEDITQQQLNSKLPEIK